MAKGNLVRGISTELQEEILAYLLFDNEMYASTKDIFRPEFFNGDTYQNAFKALVSFHNKTKANPTIKDMMIQVSLFISDTQEVLTIKNLIQRLYADFIDEYILKEDAVKKAHFEEFIRRNGCEYCFETIANQARNNEGVDWDKVIPHFKKYTDFSIGFEKPHSTSDKDFLRNAMDEIVGEHGQRKIKFFLDVVNRNLNNEALTPGTLTMVSAAPGVGKSQLLVNQGVSATVDGFTSLHMFLGDIDKYNALCRYYSCFARRPIKEILKLSINELEEFMDTINTHKDIDYALDRNYVVTLKAGVHNVDEICNEIEKAQLQQKVKYDQIMIDYDSNIKTDGNNMYDDGGIVYNKLREYGIKNKSVMFVAAQPKIQFYQQEILPLESASESSQKQHVVDLMITLGRPGKLKAPISKLFLPKNRNGVSNIITSLYRNGDTQEMYEISENEYDRFKRESSETY